MLLEAPIVWPSMPVNRQHNLAVGLSAWWLVLPQFIGGTRLVNIAGGRSGTLINMPSSPTATSGLAKGTSRNGGFGELRFDGTNDYVNVGVVRRLSTTNITVSAWVKANGSTFLDDIAFVTEEYIPDGMVCFTLGGNSSGTDNNSIFAGFYTGSAWVVATQANYTGFGVWTHIAGTYDGVTIRLYVNGVQVGTKASAAGLPPPVDAWHIGGSWENTPSRYVDGKMDDVRIYNRVLSASEVFSVYQQPLNGYRGILNCVGLFPYVPTVTARVLTAQFGSYTYAGQVASLLHSQLVSNVQGAYTYTGQAASLLAKRLVSNNQGSYAYSGQAVSLLKKKLISNVQGAYAYTGQVGLLERSRFIPLVQGSYTYSGQPAVFQFGKSVIAVSGSYTYTGQTINSIWQQIIAALGGNYVYTGQIAQLLHKQSIVLAQGSYTYNGQDIVFRLGKSLNSVAGNYAYTGQAINTLWKQIITAVSGSYSYSGQPVTLSIHTPFVILPIGVGVYTYTGQDVTLLHKQLMLANSGSYTYTGQSVSLRESGIVSSMLQGSYIYTGQVVTLLNKQLIPLVTGVYTLNGQDVGLLNKHINVHAQGGYSYTGQSVSLLRGKPLLSITGNYIYTGQAVQFPYSQRLSALFGQYVYTGQSVSLLAIVQEALFIIEMNIIPTVNGTVKIQAFPIGPASNVIVKQGSTAFMFDVP